MGLPFDANVQVPVKLPWPVGVKLIVPAGLEVPAPAVSITLTVTAVGLPTRAGLVPNVTLVDVERPVTLRLLLPLLVE